MRSRLFALILIGLATTLLLVQPAESSADVDGPLDEVPPGVEVQARGPVHEAFAVAQGDQVKPGPIIVRDPPRMIEEIPPDEKPDGDNVIWIPGYWAWDDESDNFLWVSGFWRAVPPGRTWIPGNWQKVGAGHRWVSGYWGVEGQDEMQYLPPPPATIDNGPSTPAPGDNFTYVPGNWVFQTTRYAWQPGYWVPFRPGWVWTSPCYRWTPCGYVYVPGYWDYPLLDRGLLFAPVCFPTGAYLAPGFFYRPAFCVQPDFLCGALFVRRGFGCYYFGDYFGPGYRSSFVAWNRFRFGGGVGLDLNFCYYRNAFRGFPAWERGLNGLVAGRYGGIIAPPPRTLVQQNTVINNFVVNKTVNNVVNNSVNVTNLQNVNALTSVRNARRVNVTAMSSLAGLPANARNPAVSREMRVARLNAAQLAQEKQGVTRFNAIANQRRNVETKLAAKAPRTETAAPIRARLDLPKDTPPPRRINTPTPPAVTPGGGRPNVDVATPNRPGRPGKADGQGSAGSPTRPLPNRPGQAGAADPKSPPLPKGETRPIRPGATTPPLPKGETRPIHPSAPPLPKSETPPKGDARPGRPGAADPKSPPLPKGETRPIRPGATTPPLPKGATPPKGDTRPGRPGVTPPLPKGDNVPARPLPMPNVENPPTRPNPTLNRPGAAQPPLPQGGNPTTPTRPAGRPNVIPPATPPGSGTVIPPGRPNLPGGATTTPARPNLPGGASTLPSRPNLPGGASTLPSRPNLPGGASTLPARPNLPGGGAAIPRPNLPANRPMATPPAMPNRPGLPARPNLPTRPNESNPGRR